MREIVAENPELLFRMDYYMDAPMLDYLPIEIQNMMVLTGQGLSELGAKMLDARMASQTCHHQPMKVLRASAVRCIYSTCARPIVRWIHALIVAYPQCSITFASALL